MLDFELALAIVFVLLAAAGFVYAANAAYLYFRFERNSTDKHVPVAISIFAIHYGLVFGQGYTRSDVFLPLLLIFLTALALALVIWLGSQARSKAGIRIVLAGLFSFAAFVCRTGHDIYRFTKFSW